MQKYIIKTNLHSSMIYIIILYFYQVFLMEYHFKGIMNDLKYCKPYYNVNF